MRLPTPLLWTAGTTLALAACAPAPSPHAMHHDDMPTVAAPAATTTASVYQLPGDWRDQRDALRPLSSLAGRPQVVAFVYTHCSFACPRIVARMKAIESRTAELGSDVGLVLVSIDPERDTPERLADYAAGTRLDPDRWTLLNGSDEQILELSVLLGVQYRATGDGEFAHTNALILLDEVGAPVLRLDGLDAEVGPIVDRVAEAARS